MQILNLPATIYTALLCIYNYLHNIYIVLGISNLETGFPGGSDGKCLPAMRKTRVQFLCQEDPLEKEMATHSSTLAWKIPWTEEPDIQSMGSQRAGHD